MNLREIAKKVNSDFDNLSVYAKADELNKLEYCLRFGLIEIDNSGKVVYK